MPLEPSRGRRPYLRKEIALVVFFDDAYAVQSEIFIIIKVNRINYIAAARFNNNILIIFLNLLVFQCPRHHVFYFVCRNNNVILEEKSKNRHAKTDNQKHGGQSPKGNS